MPKNYVSNSAESSRMFASNFLESLSKVHYSVPLFIFVPVIFYLLSKSLTEGELSWYAFSLTFLGGVFVWTFTEYVMHRFVFHFSPRGKFLERVHFIFHGVHHDFPNDARRLVMPPTVSIPLAIGFYYFFAIFMEEFRLAAFFSGFIAGYLFYDMSHYALHHANFKSLFWKKLKKNHMQHHYSDASKGYGVSSDIWDRVFETLPGKPPRTNT